MKTLSLLVLLILSYSLTYANSEESKSSKIQNPQEEINYIKISDVTHETTKVLSDLKKIEEALQTSDKLKDIQTTIKPYIVSVDLMIQSENYQFLDKQNIRGLQKIQGELDIHFNQLSEFETSSNANVKKYNKFNIKLKKYAKLWKKTYDHATTESAPQELLEHIDFIGKGR